MAHTRVNLLCFNIQAGAETNHYGHYLTGAHQHVFAGKARAKHLRDIAETASVFDVVALQEADSGSLRSGFIDQAASIASQAGKAHVYTQNNRIIGGKVQSGLPSIARSGNAVISKKPAIRTHGLQLPGRGRGALIVQFEHYTLVNLHLSLTARLQTLQLDFLAHELTHFRDRALVVCGDFNATCDSHVLRRFLEHAKLDVLAAPPSFPSWAPNRAIDLVLGCNLVLGKAPHALSALASDHLPIAVSLQIKKS